MQTKMKSWFISLYFAFFFLFTACDPEPSFNQEETLFLVAMAQLAAENSCTGSNEFWARNLISGASSYCVKASLVGESTNIKLYLEDGLTTTMDYTEIVTAFESKIHPVSVSAFGSPSDINNDGKITVLILDVRDGATSNSGFVAGFVDPINFFADSTAISVRSNQMEILYMDGNELDALRQREIANGLPDTFLSTLAHELQHLIRYPNQDTSNTDLTWIDEGTSEVASDITGYGPQTSRMECFRGASTSSCSGGVNGTSLISWSNTLTDYSFAYAFMKYLYQISGSSNTQRYEFLKSTVVGSVRANTTSALMSAFAQSSGYNSSVLPSDQTLLFKYLFTSFMGQAVNYTDFSTVYIGSTSATDLSNVKSNYPLPSDLEDIRSFSAISQQSSVSLTPGQTYRYSGSSSGISSGSNGVILASGSSEYVVFNGNINGSTAEAITSASLYEVQEFPKLNLQRQDSKHIVCPQETLRSIHNIQNSQYQLKRYYAWQN
ncbi:MAG: peptidase MA family protein [Spirochaetota bacterium]